MWGKGELGEKSGQNRVFDIISLTKSPNNGKWGVLSKKTLFNAITALTH